jgi:putative redox protein
MGCDVELEAERATSEPKVFTKVKIVFHLRGYGLKPTAVERAIKLSAEKYCSASVMIGKTAAIEHSWTITEEGPEA